MERHYLVAETERLSLRRLVQSDLDFMAELLGSLDVMRFSLTGPLLRSQAAEILAGIIQSYSRQSPHQWGVALKSTGQLIGLSGFLSRPGSAAGEWELAYRFLPDAWHRGLATEAAIACRDLALQTPGVITLSALVEPGNVASVRVVEKAGLKFDSQTQLEAIPVLKYLLRHPDKT